MNDLNWYLLGLLIMSLIFLCGYKIGSHFGWRDGFNTARLLESQHAMARWLRMRPAKDEKPWDYVPLKSRDLNQEWFPPTEKRNGCSDLAETAVPTTMQEQHNNEEKQQCK